SAEVIFIPKPNKRDLTSPRSWRPISLLSCLGKGLERLVARRVSFAAITQKSLHPQQFGALCKRSATDLVGCLIHNVEKARARKHVASLLTMDIKGAFDTVLPGRLQNRLCEQGWLIRWVTSFISQRSAKIRFENIVSQDKPLTCGLPQGSPISPILFMLYTEPILKLRGSPPQLVRQAIKACVIPVVLCGAEVWYPGITEFAWRNGKRLLKNGRNGKQVSRINRAIISGLRAILPVYKTTPLPTLYRKSGILSAFELLKYARIRSLDELHPLRQRAFEHVHTCLTQLANLLPGLHDSDIPLLLQNIPSPQEPICSSIQDIHLYTDRSCHSLNSTGGGYIAYQCGQKVNSGKFRLHNFAAAVDAEITAIAEGIEAVIRSCSIYFARNLIVFSDCKTAVDIGNGRIPLTSQVQALRIRQFQKDWLLRRRLLHVALGTITKSTPPKVQSREDRRVMIRLAPDYEARKTGAFELRQKVQQLVSDKSLVSDVWPVPSGFAILAQHPLEPLLFYKTRKVDKFHHWTFTKKIQCLDGLRDPLDGLLSEELASVRDTIPIRFMNWTRRSQNDQSTGHIRISVPESKSNKFPSRLRIFGETVFVQRIRQREQPAVCTKCHGFHTTRIFARNPKCKTCSSDVHDGPYDKNCPARPRRINGVFVHSTGAKLYQIHTAGGREFAKTNPQSTPDSSQLPPSSLVNVVRSPSAHDLALVTACNNEINILLIQEPWIFTDLALRRSKTHPSFEAFSPLSTWNSRPKVFTYVRKGKELRPFQQTTDLSRDLLQISISLHRNRPVSIWNIYNAPTGSDQEEEGLTTL
ncbi:hypothetical protein EPUL_004823, partial [Erysiphe pulchra]